MQCGTNWDILDSLKKKDFYLTPETNRQPKIKLNFIWNTCYVINMNFIIKMKNKFYLIF